ncbi:unnamed protein product (macronuclear) [Paramecium tetraurelia]|uniref:Cystatin domain-containing protein n=1 Tax=Paramecium tetraurelia TaxID=5888 RepID=A0E6Z9_PARTE|nr:uncharacterized protein GSPATT00023794001 [Paramecium tetraurelia]CAK91066.1 unnamed protein product [Paramecium tetraurelia]|eukprot:XP_001458463.1 hypothetical protein (macronuclear) [Paramecium tetraurelia strain d4-2]
MITQAKRHFIENKIQKNQELLGGVRWQSPNNYKNDENYFQALEKAKQDFHKVCHLPNGVTWVKVEKVGLQIVQGRMWWFEVKLSDKKTYQMEVYQDLQDTFELDECNK